MGFPAKKGHFGAFWGYHQLRKHPYGANIAYIPSKMKWDHTLKGPYLFTSKGFITHLHINQSIKNEMGRLPTEPPQSVSRAISNSG